MKPNDTRRWLVIHIEEVLRTARQKKMAGDAMPLLLRVKPRTKVFHLAPRTPAVRKTMANHREESMAGM
jgi:hypothetical protein